MKKITERQKIANQMGVPVEAICPDCLIIMKPVYENNGFEAPNPTKIEFSHFECRKCGRTSNE